MIAQTDYVRETAKSGFVFTMEHAGFSASLKRARRIADDGRVHGLPTGVSVPVFPIASLPAAPREWVRAAGTYVCPVDCNWGLWFDWTGNDAMNTAIVPSCKGMNPITGQRLLTLGLEQYADKCPVHDKPFAHGRICEECGYEWPPQNYVCHPNTLWWDGLCQPDGIVRQFFFSDDESRDIASLVIGKENTVPAFGFGFYRTKVRREHHSTSYIYAGWYNEPFYSPSTSTSPHYQKGYETISISDGDSVKSSSKISCSDAVFSKSLSMENTKSARGLTRSVSVGAGAKIRQKLEPDTLGLKEWEDEPAAIIRLYFVFEEQFRQIVRDGGVKEIRSNPNGYLEGLPVG